MGSYQNECPILGPFVHGAVLSKCCDISVTSGDPDFDKGACNCITCFVEEAWQWAEAADTWPPQTAPRFLAGNGDFVKPRSQEKRQPTSCKLHPVIPKVVVPKLYTESVGRLHTGWFESIFCHVPGPWALEPKPYIAQDAHLRDTGNLLGPLHGVPCSVKAWRSYGGCILAPFLFIAFPFFFVSSRSSSVSCPFSFSSPPSRPLLLLRLLLRVDGFRRWV